MSPQPQIAMSGTGDKFVGTFGTLGSQRVYFWQLSSLEWSDITPPADLALFDSFEALAASADCSKLYLIGRLNNLSGTGSMLLRSTDSGQTWVSVALPAGVTSTFGPELRTTSDGSALLLGNGGSPGSPRQLWRSNNGGDGWTELDLQGATIPASASFTISADGQKIAVPSRVVLDPMMMTETSMLSISEDGGLNWTSIPDPFPQFSSSTNSAYSSSGTYLFSGSGNLLIFRGYESGLSGGSYQNPTVLVSTSANLGQTWRSTFNTTPQARIIPAIASDFNGSQIALAAPVYYDPMNPDQSGWLYLTAARSVLLYGDTASAELIYRGNGRWALVNSQDSTPFLSIAPQP